MSIDAQWVLVAFAVMFAFACFGILFWQGWQSRRIHQAQDESARELFGDRG